MTDVKKNSGRNMKINKQLHLAHRKHILLTLGILYPANVVFCKAR